MVRAAVPYNQGAAEIALVFLSKPPVVSAGKGERTMPNPKKGLSAGKTAPDFTLLPALSEAPVRLSDYRGQWVVLLFFRGLV
jgi:hypothetical protein